MAVVRGLAVLFAGAAVWIAVAGDTPAVHISLPRATPRVVVSALVLGVLAAVVALASTGIEALAGALAVLAAAVPVSRAATRSAQKQWDEVRAWPDVLAQVRNGLASGSPLADALVEALARSGGSYSDMAEVIRREAIFGGGLVSAMAELRSGGLHATAERILVTLSVANDVGGPRVGDMVGTLARSVADDIRLREAHRAALTEQRLTTTAALAAPWVMLVLAVLTNPQAADAFDSGGGGVVIGIGLLATFVGWVLARRAARLTEPPTVFR